MWTEITFISQYTIISVLLKVNSLKSRTQFSEINIVYNYYVYFKNDFFTWYQIVRFSGHVNSLVSAHQLIRDYNIRI